MNSIFHYRARALILSGDYVLIARAKGHKTTFLPGGHIEAGERAAEALVREIQEELGVVGEIKEFLGVIENSWQQEDGWNSEINLIFAVTAPDLHHETLVISKEEHIEFEWCPLGELAKKVLLPESLQSYIPQYAAGIAGTLWALDGEWGAPLPDHN